MTVLSLDEAIRVLKEDYKDTLIKIETLKRYFNTIAVGCINQKTIPAISYMSDEWSRCTHENYPFPRDSVCCLENCPLGRTI